jgi:ferrous iron transport protein A
MKSSMQVEGVVERVDLADRVYLGAVRTGEVVYIHHMVGGHHFLSRLASLGFTPGARLRMVQNARRGPIIVSIRDTRVALGRGEAGRIIVERALGGDDGW